MKIRNQRLIAVAGWCGTQFVQTLSSTLRFDFRSLGSIRLDPTGSPPHRRFIYALWHENFLIPITRFGDPSVAALVSSHTDGQLLGSLIHASGMGIVRGSTSRGGISAVRKLLRDDISHRHLAVTPDGPRGPRRQVQPGIVYLASRTGMQIVPMGIGHRKPWRVRSWDSFVIPKPFSRVRCLFGEPLVVPPNLDSDLLEPHRNRLQAELNLLSQAAENWAETGILNEPSRLSQSHFTVPVIQHPSRIVQAEVGVGCDRDD